MHNLSDTVERKFIESFDIDEWEIETDSGWHDITALHKTVEYEVYRLVLENGMTLDCADTHIVFDENLNERFVNGLSIGEFVVTAVGPSKVTSVTNLGYLENMYDLTVDSDDHRYYTNGILSHNTQTTASYILHYILFNETKTVAILANKASTAKEIISRIKTSFEELPDWLQIGVAEWNKHSIELANGSRVVAAATSGSAIRGMSISLLYLDEFAFLHPNMAMEFFESVYPTISSGKETKILISSTPKGLNHFYRMYEDAANNRSEFKAYEITWDAVPGRDEAWKQNVISTIGQQSWEQEYETAFHGSGNSLINGKVIKEMVFKKPLSNSGSLKLYEKPVSSDHHPGEDHVYVMTVDCSEGVGGDYSVFVVTDVTQYPFRQVAVYRDNLVSPLFLPDIIASTAKMYNNAWVLIEINSSGKQVADILRFEHEYENILMTSVNERRRQQLMFGSGTEMIPGVRTTKSVKKVGCSHLKHLIENQKYIVCDLDTINEFETFSRKADSFAAEEPGTDDIVMTLVIFAWLVNQDFFKEITQTDIRKLLYAKMAERFDDDLPGMFSNNVADADQPYVDANGLVWS